MKRRNAPARLSAARHHLLVALAGFACTVPALANVSIPNAPLQSGSSIPPNVLLVMDDSGSMHWRYIYVHDSDGSLPQINLPAGVDGSSSAKTSTTTGIEKSDDNFSGCNICVVVGDNSSSNGGYNATKYMVEKTSSTNSLYYNPKVAYVPWSYPDGTLDGNADYTKVSNDHQYADYSYTGPGGTSIDLHSTDSGTASGTARYANLSNYIVTYYVIKAPRFDRHDAMNYYRYQILKDGTIWRSELAQTNTGNTAGKGCNDSNGAAGTVDWRNCTQDTPTGRSEANERQNFANWYTYYETRTKTGKGGLTAAFASLAFAPRVGYRTIHDRNNIDIPVGVDDGLFEDKAASASPVTPAVNNKTNWYKAVVQAIASSGTPLQVSLDNAGKYYQKTSSSGPYGPESGTAQLSCRQNFTILTTDGYWNTSTVGGTVGSSDNAEPSPFGSAYSNTLADVAYYYWKNDLRPDLLNKVGTSSTDAANWQHMTTFTISIGLRGTLDPATVLSDIASNTPVTWPKPIMDTVTTVDDLFHAAINGHGQFVVASDPVTFTNALKSALSAIQQTSSTSANVSVTGARLVAGTQLFASTFTTGAWTGDVLAFPIDTSGNIGLTPNWQASKQIPAYSTRKIFTWIPGSGVGTTFPSGAQSAGLGGPLAVRYIEGDQSKEQSKGGAFRNRSSVLGDLIDSSPVYVPGDTATSTPAMVYVGGNDGMLHAFNAATGVEVFAYIPGGISVPDLKALTDPNYVHQYYVDGAIAVSTKDQTKTSTDPTGKNILVGLLGRGGNTAYALDVSDPNTFGASDALWEYSDADMGNALGNPIITRVNTNGGDPAVIVGNGYNSSAGHALFYVLNIRTGALIKKLDTLAGDTSANSNGMGTPKGWDADHDGTVDLLYGGDLLGNVWEYDVSDSNANNWKPVYGTTAAPQPLFVAKDAGGNRQPITGGFTIGLNPADFSRWVFFGTGRYLTNADPDDLSVQTWYGLKDAGPTSGGATQITGRSVLKQRSIVAEAVVNGSEVRAFGAATSGDMAGYLGWYVDLKDPTARGERMVTDSQLIGNVLIASSIIPSKDPCDVGGSGFVNAIDPFTGGALTDPFFDLNGDGAFGAGDTITGPGGQLVAGSIDPGVGMPGQFSYIGGPGGGLFGSGSKGTPTKLPTPPPTNSGRISWREILIGN